MGQNKTKVRVWVKWATNKVRSCWSDGFQKGQCGSDGYKKIIRGQMGSKKVRSWESDGLQKGQIMGVRWVTKRSDSVGQMGYKKRAVWVQQVVLTQPAAMALKVAGASIGFFRGES